MSRWRRISTLFFRRCMLRLDSKLEGRLGRWLFIEKLGFWIRYVLFLKGWAWFVWLNVVYWFDNMRHHPFTHKPSWLTYHCHYLSVDCSCLLTRNCMDLKCLSLNDLHVHSWSVISRLHKRLYLSHWDNTKEVFDYCFFFKHRYWLDSQLDHFNGIPNDRSEELENILLIHVRSIQFALASLSIFLTQESIALLRFRKFSTSMSYLQTDSKVQQMRT